MKSLFYDTETTGLPDWAKPSEDPCQPRITQLCAELVDDETGEVLAAMHTLIKPEGWTIPPDLEKLTGITTAKCEAFGMPMVIVLAAFCEMWGCSNQRVAHNESFDMRMVRIEIMRHPHLKDIADASGKSFADMWKAGNAFCTQGQSTRIINLPPTQKMIAAKRKGPKSPNLGEAYKFFTGKELAGAHNATADVAACKAVYFALRERQKQAA